MATKQQLLQLVGKSVIDPDFRAKMDSDPAGTAKNEGVDLTDEQLKWLKSSPSQLKTFNERLKKGFEVSPLPLDCNICIVDGH